MARVTCAEITCEYNFENRCTRAEVNFAAGHRHTVHEGFMHVWTCRNYKESERAKEIREFLQGCAFGRE